MRSELSSVARSTTYGEWCTDCARSSSTTPVWSAPSGSDWRVCPLQLTGADQGGDGASRSAARVVTRGRAGGVPDRQRGHQQCVDPLCRAIAAWSRSPPTERWQSRSETTAGHRPRGLQASGCGRSWSGPRNWAEPPPPDRQATDGKVGECAIAAGRAGGIRSRPPNFPFLKPSPPAPFSGGLYISAPK